MAGAGASGAPGRSRAAGRRREAKAGSASYRFFGGKGGVGKTTLAAASALAAAEAGGGRRVLVISTDPAHSLGDALDLRLGPRPVQVPTRRGRLDAVELDADRALARWLDERRGAFRTIAERGTYLDEEDIDRFLGLSLPGVDELVGLVEVARLARAGRYDLVVVDTAPTGHTLRLLATPQTLRRIAAVLDDMQAKHRFLAESLAGAHRRDLTDAVITEIEGEGAELEALVRDAERARFSWVLLPEALALAETLDGVGVLDGAGVAVDELVVNRVAPPEGAAGGQGGCARCAARATAEQDAITALAGAFPGRTLRLLPALAEEPRGLAVLRGVGKALSATARGADLALPAAAPAAARGRRARAPGRRQDPSPAPGAKAPRGSGAGAASPAWLETLAPPGLALLAFGGKGGVGKTTCAATAALAAAAAGRRVLLLSTDPAHSLADALDVPLGDDEREVAGAPPGLRARELDAGRAFAARRDRYLDAVDELFDALAGGSRFDASFDRAVVKDLIDLAPPGLDELLGVLTLTDLLLPGHGKPRYDLVVLDTAPTGHALRLLAMPGDALEWVRALLSVLLKYRHVIGLGELAADLVETARQLREFGALLRDAGRTRFVAVTRAAELPVRETARLIDALRRMGVPFGGLVVNAAESAVPAGACLRCARAAGREERPLDVLAGTCKDAGGCVMLVAPATYPPPRGPRALASWGTTWAERVPAARRASGAR